ncbi:UNVERIFIED_CONTAM: putative MPP superfamily phosphohydrolase [Brevibacillus sp. OAP136]
MLWYFLAIIVIITFVKAHRNTFLLTTNEIEVKVNTDEPNNKPDNGALRILHLSDLHMENLSITAEQIVKTTQGEAFDLIAITGDLLDRKRSIPHAVRYIETLRKLAPKLGIYVVFGNHDYVLSADKLAHLRAELEQIGCRVLCNETHTVDSALGKLHIIGIDDYATRRSDLAQTFATVTDDGIRLVLTHDPNVVLCMKEYHYDYLLAGHFHGGQIHWPKPFHLVKMGKLPRMNIVQGLHYHDDRPFYISEGLGQTGLNIRLRSRPEMTIHNLA